MADQPSRDENIEIKDARVIFKNFEGKEDKYNTKGNRNFCIVLSQSEADQLSAAGWNVKTRPPREPGDDPLYYLKINLKFETLGRPPRVVMVNSRNKVRLDADSAILLDMGRVVTADVRFRPYQYDPGKYSAYLVTGFFVMEEDTLEERYSDLPEQGMVASGRTQDAGVDGFFDE